MPGSGGTALPLWLRRWAALVLEHIAEEATHLPQLLCQGGRRQPRRPTAAALPAAPEDGGDGSGCEEGGEGEGAADVAAEVAAEVADHRRARVQALAFALDKAKVVLRHQVGAVHQPLCTLPAGPRVGSVLWKGHRGAVPPVGQTMAHFVCCTGGMPPERRAQSRVY